MTPFWEKVLQCSHKNLYLDYFAYIHCSTPYCDGDEVHCKDCGVFISSCGCMCNNDMSGWSNARRIAYERSKR